MTGLHLSAEAIQARRLELVEVDAQIKALGRRKSVLRAEILSGYAAPAKGVAAEQLPLAETATATTTATQAPEAPTQAPEAAKPATTTTTATASARSALQLREAVLAALRAAKGRRSGKVLATLLGESEEDIHECLMELIQRGEARGARRGGYEATTKPEIAPRPKKTAAPPAPVKSTKKAPEKLAPKAKSPHLGKPLSREYLAELATNIAAHLRQAGKDRLHINDLAKVLGKTPAHIEAAANGDKRLDVRRERLKPTGALQKLVYLGEEPRPEPPKPAPEPKKAKPKKPATTAARTLTDDIEGVLREWGSWLDVAHLEAKVREAMPLTLGPSTREWEETLAALLEAKKLERKYEYGRALFRLATPASETKPSKPKPKKASKAAPKAPSPPPPTLPVKGAMAKILEDFSIDQWAQARAEVCEKIAQKKGVSVAVGPLLLSLTCESILLGPVLELLDAAGAVTVGYRGKTPAVVTPGAKVGDEEIAADLQALARRYVLDLVEDWGGDRGPTTADLAGNLDQPPALIDSVLIELRAAQELLCDREGRWSVRSPKASAAARTAPLFDDVEPAPAVEGLEPEGDES